MDQEVMLTERENKFLGMAIELSRSVMLEGHGGPFGCIIVKGDEIVGQGFNRVTSSNDPTSHAEVVAIRDACQKLNTHQLTGCEIYASCEPCPMCLGAIYWARPDRVIFANTKEDAAAIDFDDHFIYSEINANMHDRKIPFFHLPSSAAKEVFEEWKKWDGKKPY